MDIAMTKLPIKRAPLISYADRPLGRGIATAVSMGLAPSEGGVPNFLTINGVLAQLLVGADGRALVGADGQYLYGAI